MDENSAVLANVPSTKHLTMPKRRKLGSPKKADGGQGQVFSVGSGDCGQLGQGEDVFESNTLRPVEQIGECNVVTVACGGLHNAVLDDKGVLYTWGCNDDAALGREGPEMVPIPVSPKWSGKLVQISCGDTHMAVLDSNGELFTWGCYRDGSGHLGFSSTSESMKQHTPQQITLPDHFSNKKRKAASRFKMVASGAQHTVALDEEGRMFSWGAGEQGQLGRRVVRGRGKLHLQPRRVPIKGFGGVNLAVDSVYCGSYHSFALTTTTATATSTVYSWGLNNYAQLGLGDTVDRMVPTALAPLDSNSGRAAAGGAMDAVGTVDAIVEVAGGEHHSLARTGRGRVFAFGRNDSGQLGLGKDWIQEDEDDEDEDEDDVLGADSTARASVCLPRLVEELVGVPARTVVCGGNHSLVVGRAGEVHTWGFGEMGQLGNGRERDEEGPHKVTQLAVEGNVVVGASAGGQHTVVLVQRKACAAEWTTMLENIQTGGGGSGALSGYKQQLVELYSEHNPAKVDSIDSFLIKYAGREQQLVDAVRSKYE
jgi:regulator of chromosome condensation